MTALLQLDFQAGKKFEQRTWANLSRTAAIWQAHFTHAQLLQCTVLICSFTMWPWKSSKRSSEFNVRKWNKVKATVWKIKKTALLLKYRLADSMQVCLFSFVFKLSVAAGYFLLTLFITNSRQNMMNGILSWDLI